MKKKDTKRQFSIDLDSGESPLCSPMEPELITSDNIEQGPYSSLTHQYKKHYTAKRGAASVINAAYSQNRIFLVYSSKILGRLLSRDPNISRKTNEIKKRESSGIIMELEARGIIVVHLRPKPNQSGERGHCGYFEIVHPALREEIIARIGLDEEEIVKKQEKDIFDFLDSGQSLQEIYVNEIKKKICKFIEEIDAVYFPTCSGVQNSEENIETNREWRKLCQKFIEEYFVCENDFNRICDLLENLGDRYSFALKEGFERELSTAIRKRENYKE